MLQGFLGESRADSAGEQEAVRAVVSHKQSATSFPALKASGSEAVKLQLIDQSPTGRSVTRSAFIVSMSTNRREVSKFFGYFLLASSFTATTPESTFESPNRAKRTQFAR